MQRKISFVEGEYYHLYNRGVDKRMIFTTTADYRRFLVLLYLANSDKSVRIDNLLKTYSYEEVFLQKRGSQLVAIGAFCAMRNHFHVLATPMVENGLSKFMLKLQTGYSMYFNTRYERSGALFQGPFKSEHADNDRYLKYLFSYIHLNPAKLKDPKWREKIPSNVKSLKVFVDQYPYSSLREYISGQHAITDPKHFPDYFASRRDLEAHIVDWLSLENKEE